MELNEDDRERLLADARWKWEMDQAARERQSYREGREAAEAKYKPVLEENQRALAEKERENEELRRKLREAGIDG
jgi:hypothetical protein